MYLDSLCVCIYLTHKLTAFICCQQRCHSEGISSWRIVTGSVRGDVINVRPVRTRALQSFWAVCAGRGTGCVAGGVRYKSVGVTSNISLTFDQQH